MLQCRITIIQRLPMRIKQVTKSPSLSKLSTIHKSSCQKSVKGSKRRSNLAQITCMLTLLRPKDRSLIVMKIRIIILKASVGKYWHLVKQRYIKQTLKAGVEVRSRTDPFTDHRMCTGPDNPLVLISYLIRKVREWRRRKFRY